MNTDQIVTASPPPDKAAVPTDGDVGQAALSILHEEGEPVLLATLGVKLGKHFGLPLKDMLSGRKLREFLTSQLKGQIQFVGERATIRVQLTSDALRQGLGTYHPAVWAAFYKPMKSAADGRALKTTYPIDFQEAAAGEPLDSGWFFIDRALIPDASLPKEEREAATKRAIYDWCESKGVSVKSLLLSQKGSRCETSSESASLAPSTNSSIGVEALKRLIEAVPEATRARHTLSLDLIYQLIS